MFFKGRCPYRFLRWICSLRLATQDDAKKRQTRREIFLERMDGLIPWQKLEERIRPFYAKPGQGRRPYPLPVMLRIGPHQWLLEYLRGSVVHQEPGRGAGPGDASDEEGEPISG